MTRDALFLLLVATLVGFLVGKVVISLLNRLVFP